jgi:hypothetical protein
MYVCQLAEDFFSEIRSPRSDIFFAKTPAPFPPQKNKLPQRVAKPLSACSFKGLGKTGQSHHFWGCVFCGVVTQLFLVRVLRKCALGLFFATLLLL